MFTWVLLAGYIALSVALLASILVDAIMWRKASQGLVRHFVLLIRPHLALEGASVPLCLLSLSKVKLQ